MAIKTEFLRRLSTEVRDMVRQRLLLLAALAVQTGTLQAQTTSQPLRQGLSVEQSRQAMKVAETAVKELRDKTPGTDAPKADTREFVVNVERLSDKGSKGTPKAVVTTYRYFDDTTIVTTVDLSTGKTVEVSSAKHIRTPLSDAEYEECQKLAREKFDDVKLIYEKFGDKVQVYPQFSQYAPPGDARVHRVVYLTYRVAGRDLSAPRPRIDLTTQDVSLKPYPQKANAAK